MCFDDNDSGLLCLYCFLMSIYTSLTNLCLCTASITAVVEDGGVTPILGRSYTLTCSVSGTTFTFFQWRKDGSVISGETGPTLSFSPLRLTNAGGYRCGNGTLFSNNKVITLQGTIKGTQNININDKKGFEPE